MAVNRFKHHLVLYSCRLFPSVCFHQTAVMHKFDKYNFGKKPSSRKFRGKINKMDNQSGKLFQLNPPNSVSSARDKLNVQQKTLGNALEIAVNAVLDSQHVPLELQTCNVVLAEIKVSRDSSYAVAYWKVEGEEKKELVGKLLKENIDQIRMVLPTYHHLTHTPTVYFVEDRKDSYLRRLDALFSYCSQEDSNKQVKDHCSKDNDDTTKNAPVDIIITKS